MPALNSAICWKLLYVLLETRQSAGNLLTFRLAGLLRDYTPKLICFSSTAVALSNASTPTKRLHSDNFAQYFAGLFEGDSCVIVPKRACSDKGWLYYPSIELCFAAKDFPLASAIQKTLGCGNIQRCSGKKAYNLAIKNLDGVIFVSKLLANNLRTVPKHRQLTALTI